MQDRGRLVRKCAYKLHYLVKVRTRYKQKIRSSGAGKHAKNENHPLVVPNGLKILFIDYVNPL